MTLVFAAIMGRLLDPAAFGLVAMANVVLHLTTFAARMGIGQAVVQKAALRDPEIRAAFTSGAGLGVLCWAAIWAAAPFLAAVFDEAQVVPVIQVLGATLLITGLGSTADSLLRRQFRFKTLAMRSVVSDAVGYLGVGITFAFLGAGVWSLVAAAVAQAVINATLSYSAVRHPLRPVWRWEAYRSLYSFGSRVSLISVFEFLGSYVDKLFVGRFAGAALLGQYDRAYFLARWPLRELTNGLTKVLFPGFSRIQSDLARLKRAYLSSVSIVAAAVVPLCAGMAVAAPEIVHIILGDQWGPAAEVLPLFLLAASFRLFSHFGGVVTEAMAELNKKLLVQGSYVILLIGLMFLAAGAGLWAYATALAVGEAIRNGAYILLLRRVLDVRIGDIAPLYARAAVGGATVAGSIYAVKFVALQLHWPLVVVLGMEIMVGAVTLALLFLFGPLRPIAHDFAQRLLKAEILGSEAGAMTRFLRVVLHATRRSAP